MKPNYKPLLIALLSANGSLLISGTTAAAIAIPEPRIETRTIVISGDEAGGVEQLLAAANTDAPEAPRVYKDVRVVVAGDGSTHVHASPPIPPIPPVPNMPDVDFLISNAMSEAFSSSAAGFSTLSRTPVKNAPYSAEVISEKMQLLPDGNQISHRTSSLAYRDSAGRTRQEVRDDKGEVRTIQIHDAVDGTRYVVSPSKKSATKIALDTDIAKRVEEIREKAKAAAKADGKSVIIERGNPGETIVVKRMDGPRADGKNEVREETIVNVIRIGGDNTVRIDGENVSVNKDGKKFSYKFGPGADPMGAAMAELGRLGTLGPLGTLGHSFHDARWAAKATKTDLGSRDFEGVRADGKRTSYTIPAGEVGNRNPITVTSESWYSPDLQVTVYSKQSDPRTGDSIYRLANVKRIEQPLSLFRVPEDYAIRSTRSIAVPTPPVPPAKPLAPIK
jgi:hypothetical protein